MNEPLSSCCNELIDDEGYCRLCGRFEYDIEDDDIEEWEKDVDDMLIE